jgi:DNA-binding ferritin-like protein
MDDNKVEIEHNRTSKGLILVAWILLSIHILAILGTLSDFNSPTRSHLGLLHIREYPITVLGGIAAELVGLNILCIVALFLGWIAQHRSKNGKPIIITSLICFLIMSSLFFIKQGNIPETDQSVDKEGVEKLVSDLRRTLSGKLPNPESVDWEKYGEFGPLIKLIEEFWFRSQTHMLEINEKILEHDVSSVFQINTLTSVAKITQLKTNTQEIMNILEEYEKKTRILFNDFSDKIKQVDYFNEREQLLARFSNSSEKAMEYFRIMKEYFIELQRFLNYVESRQSHITVKGDKIFFDTHEEAELYKEYCYKLIELAAEETEWRQNLESEHDQLLEELDALVGNL